MAEISFQISPIPGLVNDIIAVIYKTTSPAAEVDRKLKAAPHASPHAFQFSDLAAGVYLVKIHETTDGTTLGTLRHDFWQDTNTGQLTSEMLFYTVNGSEDEDPAEGDTELVDAYLDGKTILGVFMEGFRYLQPGLEWEPLAGGGVKLLGSFEFNGAGQVWTVEIAFSESVTPPIADATFSEIVHATANLSLGSTHYNKSIFVQASANKQTTTLPLISSVPDGKGYLIRHDGGNAVNVRIQAQTSENIRFLGVDKNYIELGKGEYVILIKQTIATFGTKWYCIKQEGNFQRLGEIVSGYTLNDNGVKLDGTEYDITVYRRLGDIVAALPSGSVVNYTDWDTTTPNLSEGGTVYLNRGKFAYDDATQKVKVPDLRKRTLKFQSDLTAAAGVYEADEVGKHYHDTGTQNIDANSDVNLSPRTFQTRSWDAAPQVDNNDHSTTRYNYKADESGVATENRVKSALVIPILLI